MTERDSAILPNTRGDRIISYPKQACAIALDIGP